MTRPTYCPCRKSTDTHSRCIHVCTLLVCNGCHRLSVDHNIRLNSVDERYHPGSRFHYLYCTYCYGQKTEITDPAERLKRWNAYIDKDWFRYNNPGRPYTAAEKAYEAEVNANMLRRIKAPPPFTGNRDPLEGMYGGGNRRGNEYDNQPPWCDCEQKGRICPLKG